MKRYFTLLLIVLCAALSLTAFSPKMKITGHVHIYGNAPHTFVGFVTDEGRQYSLVVAQGSDFSAEQLSDLQGTHLELTGKIIKNTDASGGAFQILKDGRFVVESYSKVK